MVVSKGLAYYFYGLSTKINCFTKYFFEKSYRTFKKINKNKVNGSKNRNWNYCWFNICINKFYMDICIFYENTKNSFRDSITISASSVGFSYFFRALE